VLFFQCIAALFNPTHRRGEPIKWGLVLYTVLMLSVSTIYTATALNVQSISLIDNRDFPGVEGSLPPGPPGYRWLIHSKVLTGIIPNLMFLLGNWLADCLMVSSLSDAVHTRASNPGFPQLHRCYILFSRNLWIISFPCLMFLASVGTYLSSPQTDSDALG